MRFEKAFSVSLLLMLVNSLRDKCGLSKEKAVSLLESAWDEPVTIKEEA